MYDKQGVSIILKNHRAEENLSIRDLAKLCGVSHTTIFRMENSETIPSIDNLYKVAKGIGVELNDFISE